MSQSNITHIATRVSAPNTHAAASSPLALGAVVGPMLLTAAWITLGLIRPPTRTEWGISGGVVGMITQPISGLGVGTNGILFNAAFVLSGLLVLVGVFGVFRTVEANGRSPLRTLSGALLALTGFGLILCGVFTLQSFLLHMLGFLLGCFAPVASFLVAGILLRRSPRWRRFGGWLCLGSPLTLILIVVFFVSFDQNAMAAARGIAGITERILIVEVLGWFVAMGWLAARPYEGQHV